jgi:hypothetical protein
MRKMYRTLTQRDLNRAVLARQMLLERATLSIPSALEQMAGLQAQYAPAMYLGLWSRVHDLRRSDVTAGLERREIAQGTLLRHTIHLVSAADYWPFAIAVRQVRRTNWLKATRRLQTDEELTALAATVRARLERESPITRRELDAITGGSVGTNGVGVYLDLVRVPPSGTWERRRADLYALAEDWLGPPPAHLDEPAAVAHVIRRYLQGFGPATAAEIANWAGLPAARVTQAVQSIDVERFTTEDGSVLVDLRDAEALRPDPDTPAPVRFLPVWDAILLVHARRSLVIREEDRPRIFNTKTPHSLNTFLVDGQVEGSWKFEKKRVTIDPFRPLTPKVRRQVEEEADALAAFHA